MNSMRDHFVATTTRLLEQDPALLPLTGTGRRLAFAGVPAADIRKYGTARQHDAALGLDAAGLRERIRAFTRSSRGPLDGAAPSYYHLAIDTR